eukprot:scaffold128519_cov22-Tisochrysis_lutea.AAC.2
MSYERERVEKRWQQQQQHESCAPRAGYEGGKTQAQTHASTLSNPRDSVVGHISNGELVVHSKRMSMPFDMRKGSHPEENPL